MDKILKIKLFTIALFVGFTSFFYYDEFFIENTNATYSFDNIAFMVASITFGVIISASTYNLAFYFYIRNRQYLYYGLTQLSILFFLINLDSIFIAPFDEVFKLKNTFFFDLSRASILLFSMLFIKEFLKPYKVSQVNRVIQTIFYLTLLDILFALISSFTIFTNFVPIFILIWLVLSEASREVKEKDMPFNALRVGWYTVIFVAAIEHIGFIDMIGVSFPFIHVTFAIESIFLSLAISYKFKLVEEKQKTQQSLLLQQSRLASMGEMVSIIAHQWRQPLNFLSMANMNLKRLHEYDKDSQMLIGESNKQIEYMSQTIDNFRDFYNPSKHKEQFSVESATKAVLEITSHSLSMAKINISFQIEKDYTIYGNKNEFEQVILNLINNAKDALIEASIKNPRIAIVLNQKNLIVTDNAKGIKQKDLDKIFDPYFSTKEESDGIGLYISKMIIEQEMGAKLEVETSSEGTRFIICF